MSEGYVIAVGSACIDENNNADRWPELGDKCLIRPTGDLVGGMIANAACVLAGYGLRTCMFDALNSRQADFILKDLKSYGLDVEHVRIDDSLPDAKCIIVRTPTDRAILVVSEPKPDIVLTKAEEEFFSGAAYVYSTPSEMRKIVGACAHMRAWRAGGVRIVLDVESSTYVEADEDLLKSASMIFFNEFGFANCLRGRSEVAFRAELFDAGVEVITVTLGAAGSETWTRSDHDRTGGTPGEGRGYDRCGRHLQQFVCVLHESELRHPQGRRVRKPGGRRFRHAGRPQERRRTGGAHLGNGGVKRGKG